MMIAKKLSLSGLILQAAPTRLKRSSVLLQRKQDPWKTTKVLEDPNIHTSFQNPWKEGLIFEEEKEEGKSGSTSSTRVHTDDDESSWVVTRISGQDPCLGEPNGCNPGIWLSMSNACPRLLLCYYPPLGYFCFHQWLEPWSFFIFFISLP